MRIISIKNILATLMTFVSFSVFAQDYTFSNHNVVPFSLNPALAGNANNVRFGLNYRQQWPSLGNKYHTIRASYDQNFFKRKCCLGVSYSMDNQAAGIYVTHDFAGTYAHCFQLSDGYYLRLGVQCSFLLNKFDYEGLSFEDQYDYGTNSIKGGSTENFDNVGKTKCADFNAGVDFNIENKLNVGVAMFHTSEPDNGFINKEENVLHRKFVFHANYVKDLVTGKGLHSGLGDTYLFINGTFQKQDIWKQAELGAGLFFAPFIAGVTAKSDLSEITTMSLMIGTSVKTFQLYYIYDLFISDKRNGSWSHEISMMYVFRTKEKYPCPVVYW